MYFASYSNDFVPAFIAKNYYFNFVGYHNNDI